MIFYLVSKTNVIQVEDKVIAVARKEGNVILDVNPLTQTLQCLVKNAKSELSSTTGVLLNGNEISFEEKYEVKADDLLKIGIDEYKVFTNFEEAQKVMPKHNRRRYKRPNNAYEWTNFVNFYGAFPWTKAIYLCTFLLTGYFFFSQTRVEGPETLSFLIDYHNSNVVILGILSLLGTYLICLAHGFSLYLYFNRRAARQFVSTVAFLFIYFGFIYWVYRPFKEIRAYTNGRAFIQSEKVNKNFHGILSLINSKDDMKSALKFMRTQLPPHQSEVLKQDYEMNKAIVDQELKGKKP